MPSAEWSRAAPQLKSPIQVPIHVTSLEPNTKFAD